MRRRKVVDEFESEIDEEVVTHWSGKRIIIAIFVAGFLIVGGLYALSLMVQNKSVLGENVSKKPQIQIPSERMVESVIEKAKEDLSNINAKNIISSQPKLQQIINDLTNLTGSSTSAKNLICNAICD